MYDTTLYLGIRNFCTLSLSLPVRFFHGNDPVYVLLLGGVSAVSKTDYVG